MALDLRESDRVVIGSNEYPIRSIGEWTAGSMAARKRLCTQTITTKRADNASGKFETLATKLTGVKASVLMPVIPDPETSPTLEQPFKLYEIYLDGTDTVYHVVVEERKA